MAHLTLVRNSDGTYTIKAGAYVEHVSGDKMPMDLLDAVRWAAITAGVVMDESAMWDRITELKEDG
jgi:hypothetical protein